MKLAFSVFSTFAVLGLVLLNVSKARAAVAEQPLTSLTFEQRYASLPKDALDRRARSIAVLKAEGVPINQWLPTVDAEQDVTLPSTEQVAMRAAANVVVALKGEGMPQKQIDVLVREYGLAVWFSPNEAKFINDPKPTDRERQIQTWRYEAANALLWCLGFVDRLDGPRGEVDSDKIASIILNKTRAQFVASANMRSKSEILDQVDLIYRYRWALVDARLNNRQPPQD